MPSYDYICKTCDIEYTVNRPITEAAIIPVCPECDVVLTRKFSAPSVAFNGEGFYSTDKE